MSGANENATEDPQDGHVEVDPDNGDGQDEEAGAEIIDDDNITDVGDTVELRNAVEEEYEGNYFK